MFVDWHRLTAFDYVICILGHHEIPRPFDEPAMCDEWRALRHLNDRPSPTALRSFLTKWNFMTEERNALVEDYEYYLSHRAHRRPAVWLRRLDWGALTRG